MPERLATRITRRRGPVAVRRHAALKAVLAIMIIAAGLSSMAAPGMTAVPSVRLLGLCLTSAGLVQVFREVFADRPPALMGSLGLGLVNIAIGSLFIAEPQVSIRMLSLVLACAQLLIGVNKVAAALRKPGGHRGLTLIFGLTLITVGTLIAAGWPDSGLVAIGRFVGINMMVEGVTWLASLRRAREAP